MSAEHGLYISPDPHTTRLSTGHYVQQKEIEEGFMVVRDPQLGSFAIGNNNSDNIYYRLFTTADAFRSGGISNLSKRDFHGTIPNLYSFNRDWHTTSQFRIIEDRVHAYNIDEQTFLAYVLPSIGSDRAHGPFSHAADIIKEKWSGAEDTHESYWAEMAAFGGTKAVLDEYGVQYDENLKVKGVILPPWIESPHPDLNVDRFQYAVAELLLWFDHDQAPPEARELVRSICSPDNLAIDKGRFVFKDEDIARIFSKGYLLLTTEHWNDPINRVQLHLLIEATKRAIARRRIDWMDTIDKGLTRRPDGYLLGIDQDIVQAMNTGPNNRDDFMFAARNLLQSISIQERERFVEYKLAQYSDFLRDEKAHDYPSEMLTPKRVEFGPESSVVEIEATFPTRGAPVGPKMPEMMDEEGVCYKLSPLKNRHIDPLVMTKKHGRRLIKKLSEIDPNYANLLKEQQQVRSATVVVRLALTRKFNEDFKEGLEENKTEFAALEEGAPEMTQDQKRAVIELSAEKAKMEMQKIGSLVLPAA